MQKPEGKEPIGRPRHRCKNNFKIYFQEIGFRRVTWIYLAQNREKWRALVNAVMKIRVK